MLHTHSHNNYRVKCVPCVPCVPSCLPFMTNGTHLQALPHNTLLSNVYHVYHCARTRTRENFAASNYDLNFYFKNDSKKFSCVRDIILMVHMVHIFLKALIYKVCVCVPFLCNGTQKTLMVNIALQVVIFKMFFVCTIVEERL